MIHLHYRKSSVLDPEYSLSVTAEALLTYATTLAFYFHLRTSEKYTLDWKWRSNEDPIFGGVQGRSRWVYVSEVKSLGIGEGDWIEGDSEGKLIHAEGKAASGKWEAKHLWGFEMVDGERRHTRRVRVSNEKGEELRVRMVYDFVGE